MEKYWRSLDEYKNGPDQRTEKVAEEEQKNLVLDLASDKVAGAKASRRDFLKLVGFSFATAAITSSCEKPVQKAIPYLIKPEEVTPGKASYYATSFFDGNEYCSVVAKVRDGRPIKIEANELSPVSGGGTSARVQASVLELYDQARLRAPGKGRNKSSWEEIDTLVKEQLRASSSGRKVLLSSTIISPTTKKIIRELQDKYPDLEWIVYDEVSVEFIRMAHEKIFGKAVIPGYHFDKADYVVSFDADFLGTWLAPVEFASGYAKKRDVSKDHPEMSKHIQFESGYSVTGSNADERFPVSPARSKAILVKLYNAVALRTGAAGLSGTACDFDVNAVAEGLLENQGSSIVISGTNDPDIQMMVAGINVMLGNYGSTLDLFRTLNIKQGNDRDFLELKKSLKEKDVSLLIMSNVNPVFSDPQGAEIGEAIGSNGLSVYIGSSYSETAKQCQYVAPDHHYLESWGDAEPVRGTFSLQQPTINPLYDTRSFQDSLLRWTGSDQTYYEEIRKYWKSALYPLSGSTGRFEDWWNEQLQKGVFMVNGNPVSYKDPNLSMIGPGNIPKEEGMSLTLYTSVGILDGRHANNPWLQELPDPVTKACWDNYLAISVADAGELELADEDVVEVNGLRVPVLIQPGQAKGTCSLALGYGRTVAGKVGDNVGVNAYGLVTAEGGFRRYTVQGITIGKTGKTYELARTQTHHSMEDRPIVRETTLDAYRRDPNSGNQFHLDAESHHDSLYPETEFDGYHWGLAIDLNKCVGCNNCVVSCIAENNIATVGKEEVKKHRIMHWLRIDRYYSEDVNNPKTYLQPVMCQHCDNAPCENVCPVAATMHSNEGLNQVAYARCIGTKYCINNCPYRVRRFNWFKYVNNDEFNFHLNEETSKLVLNPDVTVRSRGVVEKCSFCVQRIQEKKLEAKLEERSLEDGEIQPACVQSCPTGALVFGDLNNKESQVAELKENERNYHLLEQLHTLPSVGYLTKVRNAEGGDDEYHDHHTIDHS
ncbi:MAG: TAT-variant-translocated molybdopterin oxidoreductase [Bacteroidales bacterium]|nr:TAT-variant-translocated molybdopterin oxidoreductase [Bacteroidales bacterium]